LGFLFFWFIFFFFSPPCRGAMGFGGRGCFFSPVPPGARKNWFLFGGGGGAGNPRHRSPTPPFFSPPCFLSVGGLLFAPLINPGGVLAPPPINFQILGGCPLGKPRTIFPFCFCGKKFNFPPFFFFISLGKGFWAPLAVGSPPLPPNPPPLVFFFFPH